jgi:hypothetical protein
MRLGIYGGLHSFIALYISLSPCSAAIFGQMYGDPDVLFAYSGNDRITKFGVEEGSCIAYLLSSWKIEVLLHVVDGCRPTPRTDQI